MWNIEFQFFVVDVCYYEHIYIFFSIYIGIYIEIVF